MTDAYRYVPGTRIADLPTTVREPHSDPKDALKDVVDRLQNLQELLAADDHQALLLVFQGMDAAGKDSTIKNVTSGVNPSGFQVTSFKQPTYKDVDHHFFWRYGSAVPERGRIGIFNRSHYEEVLVVRVRPEILEARRLPSYEFDDAFWQQRFADIRGFESHLGSDGIHVVKFFLNVSKNEQKARLLSRIDEPHKNWKFNPRDIDERARWDDYQVCYQQAIEATHTEEAPWYIIPADDKKQMRLLVAEIVARHLEALELEFPKPTEEQASKLAWGRQMLESEG